MKSKMVSKLQSKGGVPNCLP